MSSAGGEEDRGGLSPGAARHRGEPAQKVPRSLEERAAFGNISSQSSSLAASFCLVPSKCDKAFARGLAYRCSWHFSSFIRFAGNCVRYGHASALLGRMMRLSYRRFALTVDAAAGRGQAGEAGDTAGLRACRCPALRFWGSPAQGDAPDQQRGAG